MKRRCEGCAFTSKGYVASPKICDRLDARAGSNDMRVTNLQRVGFDRTRLVANGLAVTANGLNSRGLRICLLEQRKRCVSETLTYPVIQHADLVDCAFCRGGDGVSLDLQSEKSQTVTLRFPSSLRIAPDPVAPPNCRKLTLTKGQPAPDILT